MVNQSVLKKLLFPYDAIKIMYISIYVHFRTSLLIFSKSKVVLIQENKKHKRSYPKGTIVFIIQV
jgi:hypothetical protein